ncbi:MAG: putative addiction module antidote protein [Hyphomicrobiales bacterium]|nr:putative addiction module antidote protein [Hyphomicrobiales bacterium]MDE2115150.1 putative addiction module antidote protein [Hyphomicrobiales bacterium]
MALETTPWDSAELLVSKEAIAAYIEAAFEDGDPALIKHALGVVARAKGMSQFARETGVTREGLYKALSSDGDPKLSTLLSVLKALGMKVSARAA